MRVALLGPLTVEDNAQPIEVGGARLRALLIRLAASANGWVPVSELVEALWDEDPPGDEVNALQSLISRLRRALPKPELIESGPAGYRLAIDTDDVDAIRFERLVGRGRRLLADRHPEEAAKILTEALGLWRGPALREVASAPYAVVWLERLEKLRLTAVENWAEAGLQLGRYADLIAELEQLSARYPLRERIHELLIRALAGLGRQREALAVYDELWRNLTDELGLYPPEHLQELQAAVLRDDPALRQPVAPAVKPLTHRPRRTNLRAPLTSFIGRDDDVRQLRSRLERTRLITLVGTGGAGKTRLAVQVAAGLRDVGTDGVWLVELAPVTDPDDVASTTLGSLDNRALERLDRQPSHQDALSRLVETIAEHDVVLVLDNCEHLVDAAAKLAEYLLGQCPRLTVLATSREPLGIVGETLWPVTPLSAPAPDTQAEIVRLYESVQLFADRAALVRPGFTVNARNGLAVGEICRRLDGLPLAIELAAARLRNLPVEAVASRLGNRFRLLTGGNRTALPRHQTLRAVVAWSWDLLTESESILLARLSVFPGGATAAGAEAVCTDAVDDLAVTVPADAVPDLLTSLTDKSLLVIIDGGADVDGPRYRMLETVREFAAEQLADRGETLARRAAHARYFLELAETAEPRMRGHDQLIWADRLTAERDNLLATLRFAVDTGDAATAVRLGAALSWYWTLIGRHDQAASWLEQALAIPGERPAEAYAIARLVHAISTAAAGLGTPDAGEIAELQELVAGLDREHGHPMLVLVEPGIAMVQDDGPGAQQAVRRNLVHADPWARAMLHMMSAMIAENDGDLEQMEHSLPLALAGFRELGDRWGIGVSVAAVGVLRAARGDTAGAIEATEETRRMVRQLHANEDEAYSLVRIGMLRLRLDDHQGARRDVELAMRMADEAGSPSSSAYARHALAVLAKLEGDLPAARRHAEQALAVLERVPFTPPQVKAITLALLAGVELEEGAPDRARRELRKAFEAMRTVRDMPVAAMIAVQAAELALVEADPERAAELLGVSVSLRGMEDVGDLEVKRVGAAVEADLGADAYRKARVRGTALTRADALALLEAGLTDPDLTGPDLTDPGLTWPG